MDKKISIFINSVLILTFIFCCVILGGCSQEKGSVTSFGTKDILVEGEVLGTLKGGDDTATGKNRKDDGQTGESTQSSAASSLNNGVKRAEQLNVDSLPANVKVMAGLCDVLNRTSAETGTKYTDNPQYVWRTLRHAAMNLPASTEGVSFLEEIVEVEPEKVNNLFHVLFGKMKTLPDIPSDYLTIERYGAPASVSFSNDMKYRFAIGEYKAYRSEIKRATSYSDGSMEIEIALLDDKTLDEKVCFIYTMRANTKDTSASAEYNYEITGQRPADTLTTSKMQGIPFVEIVMQNYGKRSADVSDKEAEDKENEDKEAEAEETASDLNRIEEVPYYGCFAEKNKGVEALNARISTEIMEFAMDKEDEQEWHEICSYPVSDDNYVQVIVTYSRWPNYATDGNLKSYNYDVKNKKALELIDALTVAGLKEDEVIGKIGDAFVGASDAELFENAQIEGFLLRTDGSVDFYATIFVDNKDAGSYNRLVCFNSGSGEMRYIFDSEEVVVPKELEDEHVPELTHGIRDV